MTPEQKVAFIVAQTALMQAETEMMKTENVERERHGLAPANGPEQWADHIKRWEPVLGYNAVIQFFRD